MYEPLFLVFHTDNVRVLFDISENPYTFEMIFFLKISLMSCQLIIFVYDLELL
jgi:hypothetical protein